MIMKKILSFVVILTVMFFGISNVSAMTPTYTHAIRFSRGVKNTCYYISPSASGYTSLINTAATKWASLYNMIKNTPVSTNYATHIDFYAYSPTTDPQHHLNSNINAYTTIWSANGVQMSFDSTQNYFYTEIVINNTKNIGSDTIAHEMGHAYGLDHNNSVYSIMYGTNVGRMVTTPQSVDNDTVNYLYPIS